MSSPQPQVLCPRSCRPTVLRSRLISADLIMFAHTNFACESFMRSVLTIAYEVRPLPVVTFESFDVGIPSQVLPLDRANETKLGRFCAIGGAACTVLAGISAACMLVIVLPFDRIDGAFLHFPRDPDRPPVGPLALLTLALLLLRVGFGVLHHYTRNRTASTISDKNYPVDLADATKFLRPKTKAVDEILTYCHTRFDQDSITSARMHLMSPWLVTPRVGHSIDPTDLDERNTYIRRIDQIRRTNSYEQIAIVHRAEKGKAPSGLALSLDGDEWSTLSARDAQAVVLGVVHSMYRQLAGVRPAAHLNVLFECLATAVMSDKPVLTSSLATAPDTGFTAVTPDGKALTLKHYIEAMRNGILELGQPKSKVDQFIYTLAELARDQIIWCSISVPRIGDDNPPWNRLTYSYLAPATPRRNISERTRGILGMAPRRLRYFVPVAREAHSYHLDIGIPEGLYLYRGYIMLIETTPQEWDAEGTKSTKRDRATRGLALASPGYTLPRARVTGTGGSRAYAYFRSMSRIRTVDHANTITRRVTPTVIIELRERLPGVLLPTLLLSTYVTFAIWTVGILFDSIFRTGHPIPAVWGTLLFSIPALVSAWLLTKFTSKSISLVSIPVLILISWSILNAVLTVAFAVAVSHRRSFTWDGERFRAWPSDVEIATRVGNFFDARDAIWFILGCSTTLNWITILLVLAAKYARYILRKF